MPTRLPLDRLLVPVRQTGDTVSASSLARHASAVLFLPLAPSAADWEALPHAAMLRALHERKIRKAGDTFHLRVGPQAQTLLVVACVATEASTFERLQAAGKLARSALEGDPKTVLVWQQGCTQDAADATFHAIIAALEAAAFRFATFKSKPKSRAPLLSIDLARRGKLHEMDLTLATAAGNNLARWLTALPPNTLDAAAYRRLLKQFAQRLKLNFKFYGETTAQALGVRRLPRGGARQCHARRRHRLSVVSSPWRRSTRRQLGGQRHLLRHRRHEFEGPQRHAGHAYRHGGQRRRAWGASTH